MTVLVTSGTVTTAGNSTPIAVTDQTPAVVGAYALQVDLTNLPSSNTVVVKVEVTVHGTLVAIESVSTAGPKTTPFAIEIGPHATENEYKVTFTQTVGAGTFAIGWSLYRL